METAWTAMSMARMTMMMTSMSRLIAAMTIRAIRGLIMSEDVIDDEDLVLGRVMRLLWSGCITKVPCRKKNDDHA